MSSLRFFSTPRRITVLAAAMLFVLACASDDLATRRDSVVAASEEAYAASHRASAPPDTTDSTAARAPVAFTDNNVLFRVAQDDRLEVQVAGVAIPKITSPALKDFARQVKDNHSAGESDARRLSQRLQIPEKPAATDTTKLHQQNLVAQFNKLGKGLTFDTSYVRHLLDGHTTMLRELKSLEARASNAEVKALLRNATPEVQRHLNRASDIGKALMAGRK